MSDAQITVPVEPKALLEDVNKYVVEPYNTPRHLYNAIRQEKNDPNWQFPGVDDVDGWLEARTLAIQHRMKNQQELPDGNGSESPVIAPEAPAPNVQEPEPEPPADSADLVAACERLPEAPVVAFTDLVSPDGFRWCVTVRAGLPPDLAQQSVAQTINLMKMVENGATAKGWTAPGNGRKPAVPTQTQAAAPVAGGNGTGQFNPNVMEYAGKSAQGDKYWRCKGRPFTQHGVIVWEEVLPDELKQVALADISEDVDLTGWVAIYSQKEHRDKPGEMTPDKVIELRKVA